MAVRGSDKYVSPFKTRSSGCINYHMYLVDLIMNTPPNFDQQPIHYKIWDKMNNLAGTDSVARLFYALRDFIHHEIIHYEIVDCTTTTTTTYDVSWGCTGDSRAERVVR